MSRAYDNAADARFQQGGRRNLIINGGFQVWQRATDSGAVTSGTYHAADRWFYSMGTGLTSMQITQQSFTIGQTDVPGEPQFYQRFAETGTATGQSTIRQRIEGVRNGSAQTVTLSFWAKASSAITVTTLTAQYFGSSGSSTVNNGVENHSITTSWQKFTSTFSLASVSGKTIAGGDDYLELYFKLPTGTSTLDLALVQFELGNVATPFEHRSYGEELALCQRYYQYYDATDRLPAWVASANTSQIFTENCLQNPMRAQPSISLTDPAGFDSYYRSSYVQSSANVVRNTGSTRSVVLRLGNFSGMISQDNGAIYNTVIKIDAEL